MGTLDGKIAIISGSGRGIGREIALKLSSEGAAVVINDLDEIPANETLALITAQGGVQLRVLEALSIRTLLIDSSRLQWSSSVGLT